MKQEKLAIACPVCGSSHWSWTDSHKVARCGHCGQTSTLGDSAESTLKPEWLPKYRKWWADTGGICTFIEWSELGERKVDKAEVDAHREAQFRREVAEIRNRPKILVSKMDHQGGSAHWSVAFIVNPEGVRWTEGGKSAYWESPDSERRIQYSLCEQCTSAEEALKLGKVAALAYRITKGWFNTSDRALLVTMESHEHQSLYQWLSEDNFWACHPVLQLQRSGSGKYLAYLLDYFSHHMGTSLGRPDGEGETEALAVGNLVDRICGRTVHFSGYHSGAFDVPSDLRRGEDWERCLDLNPGELMERRRLGASKAKEDALKGVPGQKQPETLSS